jgi:peroxiredoxin Q/BCP
VQGHGFRDHAAAFEAADAVIVGASFDSVADQKTFAEGEGFPYPLISDPDKSIGKAYDAERTEGEKYFEAGIPRRITYLIDPKGTIHKAYDVEGDGLDLASHAEALLAEIRSAG